MVEHFLSTQEAADILNVSRPHIVKLIDTGTLPAVMVGTHRRVLKAAVDAFAEDRKVKRDAALNEMTADAQASGFYDAPRPTPAAVAAVINRVRDGRVGREIPWDALSEREQKGMLAYAEAVLAAFDVREKEAPSHE